MGKLDWIDLRKYFKELQNEMGFRWVALRSVDLTIPCAECKRKVADNYDQPYSGCKTCLGIGYSYVDKLVKGYRYMASPGIDTKSNIGTLNIQSQNYVVQYNAVPKNVDWILELELDEKTMIPRQPFVITSAFKIDDAHPLRGIDGKIEYWKCRVTEKNTHLGKGL